MNVADGRMRLELLGKAGDQVTLGAYGYAATVTDECRAYKQLCTHRELLPELRPELLSMCTRGYGGARIYAVLLLEQIDREQSIQLLQTLYDCAEPCTLFTGGCCGTGFTVGDVARDLLSQHDSDMIASLEALALDKTGFDSSQPRQAIHKLLTHPRLASHRLKVELLIQLGSPATRLNAVQLLIAIDAEAGHARLLELATDPTPTWDPSGAPIPTLFAILNPVRYGSPNRASRYTTVAWCARQIRQRDSSSLPPVPADPPPPGLARRVLEWWKAWW